uniref:NADP-dependent malic enzyme n=1 Tax=Tanacetum cinerariifolium TaxID=118510 RepID=A0A6L2NEB7_TANCI|nr:NADP-dependent malic enzyme [Tanacetum cinerariifolium]
MEDLIVATSIGNLSHIRIRHTHEVVKGRPAKTPLKVLCLFLLGANSCSEEPSKPKETLHELRASLSIRLHPMVQNWYGTPHESLHESREAMSARRSERPQKGQRRADYGFVATVDREILRNPERQVGYGITDLWDEIVETLQGAPVSTDTELGRYVREFETRVRQDTDEIYMRLDDEQTERQLLAGRLNMLFRDMRAHAYTRQLMETEVRMSREAWVRATDASDHVHGKVISLRTTVLVDPPKGTLVPIVQLAAADEVKVNRCRGTLSFGKVYDTYLLVEGRQRTNVYKRSSEAMTAFNEGRLIFSSGSPFDPYEYNGELHIPGQANNAYIFPRLGFGLVISDAIRVHDEMLLEASLAKQVTQEHYDKGMIYPPLTNIRKIYANIVVNVADKAYNLCECLFLLICYSRLSISSEKV